MEQQLTIQSRGISRRRFLKNAGGLTFAIVSYAYLPGCGPLSAEEVGGHPVRGLDGTEQMISAWVQIRPDGGIVVYNPSSEMGQGSMTALPVIIAEELDAKWQDVIIEYSPVDPEVYGLSWGGGLGGPMMTVGSRTVRGYYSALRIAGAQARQVLLQNVAEEWAVPIEELKTEPSVVFHEQSNRRISYGEIAAFATMPATTPEIDESQLKDPADFRLIGKMDLPRYDIPSKVNGTAMFAIDVHLPEMAYGVINRSPANGAKPDLQNERAIREIEGVIDVVKLEHGIGVIAEDVETALHAKTRMDIVWSTSTADSHTSDSAFANYAQMAEGFDGGRRMYDEGDVEHALARGDKIYTADYKTDYLYHAQMEPLNAVASVAHDGKSATVWAGTQAPDAARDAVAEALGIDRSAVTFHPHYLGGGFGRRSMPGYVVEAALLAKEQGRPVKLIWTREDDVKYGAFRPQCLQRLKAAVDDRGDIVGLWHCVIGPGSRLLGSGAETTYYTIPNHRIEVRAAEHGVRTKHWRSVAHGPNKYAIESFVDEIAEDQGVDPLDMRRRLMRNDPRSLNILETVAEMCQWSEPSPEGRAKGMAFIERSGALAAGVCEISIDASGKIRVHRFWAAVDAGIIVQPNSAIAQMEGGIVMGISSVLHESITFKDGVVQQSNYHDYPILRITEAPDSIQIRLIDSRESPAGMGETSLPLVGGAIANAFGALTGKRLRHMPFTPAKVLEVMREIG